MDVKKALQLFSLSDPFMLVELKRAFRTLSLRVHPDVGGNQADFISAQSAFEILQPFATAGRKHGPSKTLDGRLLSELGKGYPITVSARTCDSCEGKGYRSILMRDVVEITCPECDGSRLERHPCNRCKGTGSYTNPKSGKVVGVCYACKGSGWFYPENKRKQHTYITWLRRPYIPGTTKIGILCSRCRGSGIALEKGKPHEEPFYHVCTMCNGIGEVKVYNPVIPRGYLIGKS